MTTDKGQTVAVGSDGLFGSPRPHPKVIAQAAWDNGHVPTFLKALCELLMCSDPWPASAEAEWFDVLEAAQDTLHNVQYPLRAMELPPYPAGGVCGIANLGIALDHIVAAQNALDLVRDQLSHWKAMTEAYGSSSNPADEPRRGEQPTT